MDFDYVKAEKAMALRRFHRFRSIGRFFRAAELCVALLFFCWIFTRLPFAFQLSGAFLHRIADVISTPLFVFLLGNFIVVLLLTKSSDHKTVSAETEVYQAFVRSKPSDEEIVYDDKQVIVADLTSNSNLNHGEKESAQPSKVYRRSKSDVIGKESRVVIKPFLSRAETEKTREMEKKDSNYPEDNLSNEEFQKTIEAFIAKQLMFRRQESLAVVVHNKAL